MTKVMSVVTMMIKIMMMTMTMIMMMTITMMAISPAPLAPAPPHSSSLRLFLLSLWQLVKSLPDGQPIAAPLHLQLPGGGVD